MNKVEEFFDKVAPTWDEAQNCPKEKITHLLDQINIKKGDKILDVACGTGIITNLLYEYSKEKVLGIDISNEMIRRANEKYKDNSNVSFRHIDLYDLEEENQFDIAVIYNAYPHFVDQKKLVNKLVSILSPEGKFVIAHSLSRKQLDYHHRFLTDELSRSLKEVNEEANLFKEYFNIEVAKEDDNSYLIIGVRK